jgi:hypothetical protein
MNSGLGARVRRGVGPDLAAKGEMRARGHRRYSSISYLRLDHVSSINHDVDWPSLRSLFNPAMIISICRKLMVAHSIRIPEN